MDTHNQSDEDEQGSVERGSPRGQSQLEIMNLLLGTEDVCVIGVEQKHSSNRVHVETLSDEVPCPHCGAFGEPIGRFERDIVEPELFFDKKVIFVWHVRRSRCQDPMCEVTTYDDTLPAIGSASYSNRGKQ